MARPIKYGLDFFRFDVDFYHDIKIRKLIRSQSGKAVAVYVSLLCSIYKNGYYMEWDKELPFIISEETGFEEAYIQEVIKYCMVANLFSKEMFDKEGVLTSKEIQKTYLNICARRKNAISKYCLLSEEDFLDDDEVIAAETGVNVTRTPVIVTETRVNVTETPINAAISTQTKQKKSKEKEISTDVDTKKVPEGLSSPAPMKSSQKRFQKPTVEELNAYCKERGNGIDAQGFFDYYESKGWVIGKSPMKDWKAAVRNWERMGRDNGFDRHPGKSPTRESTTPVKFKSIEELYGQK